MCINASSSLGFFILSLISIHLLVERNYMYDYWLGRICFFIALVQLGEFVIWSNLRKSRENSWATKLIYMTILMQPIAIISFATLFGDKFTLGPRVLNILGSIYSVVFGFQILSALFSSKKNIQSKQSLKPPGHLVWDFSFINTSIITKILYFLAPLIFLFMRPKEYGYILFVLYYFTFLVSYMKYQTTGQWKSIWCMLGNIYPWIILVAGYKLL